jgi:hypothetical protein
VLTEASERALQGLRDPATLQWYVIPMLAVTFYIYVREIKEARATGDWGAILSGATLFGADFVNETANGWIFHLSGRSALWTAPGPSALRTMIGWNIEIMFMFAISGIVFYHSLASDRRDRWRLAAVYSVVCVCVELVLNRGGLLVWEYPFWNRTPAGLPLIFLLGYFWFYAAVIGVLALRTRRAQVAAVAGMYAVAIAGNVVGMGVLGWVY